MSLLLFVALCPQTMLVPLAENLLLWHEFEISIFYSAAGVEVSRCFVGVSFPGLFL